ncbi:WD40 repeat-like protein [Trichodelitschia bisporula]|uniref:WD40 repeat-like protein n=1 Tax=Trichodelitschia bisporula TaxID=703511 RepID=A0A6G1HYZ7_9PEZI|nr:WD40 repeat-like protein [Trichodelitschia bisporula]
MVRKQQKRISYVLPLANSTVGHRLGVNGLAVDSYGSILYSGGRDGVICAWDLNLDLNPSDGRSRHSSLTGDELAKNPPPTALKQQVQAHTHWINDIVLVKSNEALVSASSDITVKLWRPAAHDVQRPQTIGLHGDYVKCLASSGLQNWVASGGLDRKICLWDLNGAGQQLQINVGEDENTAKGSVYALAATPTMIASGGPESIVRIWDPRSGKRITKFVGHTDNIRDVLIAQDGDTVMTASSDQTVKVWSMTAGRCMYTLTMHNDSVWSLYSDHPQLSVFYSSDRSGLVAKTDTRGCSEMDEGLSVAICQEHEGVNRVVNAADYIWTATSSSSINRWRDVDTDAEVTVPDSYTFRRISVATTKSRIPSPPNYYSPTPPRGQKQIPFKYTLRLSNTAPFPVHRLREETATIYSGTSMRKASEGITSDDMSQGVPIHSLPEYTIEGQHGLIKHVMLNDRRRVLTVDTAGEVTMWDLIKCIPVKSFGKRHLDAVFAQVNTAETIAHWCAVDTRTGSLTCTLEENNCFDAEMYADDAELEENAEFREDQRINIGAWILRYLFANLIDEEIRRDEIYRRELLDAKKKVLERAKAPTNIIIPPSDLTSWGDASGPASASTLRPNGLNFLTPGIGIGLATPGPPQLQTPGLPPGTPGEGEERHARTSGDKARFGGDYFTSQQGANAAHPGATQAGTTQAGSAAAPPPTPGGDGTGQTFLVPPTPSEPAVQSLDPEKEGQEKGRFGMSRLRMNFGMKSLKKTQTSDSTKPVVAEAPSEDSDSRSSKTEEVVIEPNFLGTIQRIRQRYEQDLNAQVNDDVETPELESHITPSLPNETPVLKPPPNTTILIQEDRIDSGGVADLFEGTVGNVGQHADLVEKVAPTWLGDLLLRNERVPKDIVKISFVLEPIQGLLPDVSNENNPRLNATRMLRARKVLAYIAERIEPVPETPDPNALKPEQYLELYCQNQLIPPTMTLATIRAHVWRGGGDIILSYKANGRKEIQHAPLAAAQIAFQETPAKGTASFTGSHRSQRSQGSQDQYWTGEDRRAAGEREKGRY